MLLQNSVKKAINHILAMARNQRGNAMVLTAIAMTVAIGFSGLAVDGGLLYIRHQRLQAAADAAALAAVPYLPSRPAEARVQAEKIAKANVSTAQVDFEYPYSGADYGKVKVVVRDSIPVFFMRVLGFTTAEGSGRAVARLAAPQAFEYALFSGSETEELEISGSGLVVNGHAHTNQSAEIKGSDNRITGTLEAVSTIRVSGSGNTFGAQAPNAAIVQMPTFDADALKARATAVYATTQHFPSHQTVNGILFVQGDVHLSGTIEGVGAIVATGNIYVSGHLQYQAAGSALSLVAGGNVQISGSNLTISGIIYAPNGEIEVSGSNITFNGALVAKELELSGSNLTINYDPKATVSLPYQRSKLAE